MPTSSIVGGGMTGALVALTFATEGIPVALLEAGCVGCGSTAASSALLLQEPDRGLAELAARYGGRSSRRIWELGRDAVARSHSHAAPSSHRVRSRRARRRLLRDECRRAFERLRTEFRLRSRAGFAGEWLMPARCAVRPASPRAARSAPAATRNSILTRRASGLMRAARSAGAEIFERSPVTRIRSGARTACGSHTRRGHIDAARVVIATGYATRHFRAAGWPVPHVSHLRRSPRDRSPRRERREVGLGDVMVWDTDRPYHYARWTPDHRLLLGGADRPVRPGRRDHDSSLPRRASCAPTSSICFPHSRTSASTLRGKACLR